MYRFLVPAGIFAGLVVFFAIGLRLNPSEVPSPLIDQPAPAFALPSLLEAGEQVSDQDLRGQVTLLNVWATWCVGCREEHETLLAIAGTGEVPIVSLNWKDDADSARAWLRQLGNPYVATAVDQDGRVAIDWGVYGAPETFIVDAEGIVRYKHIGPLSLRIWEQRLRPQIQALREAGS